MAELRVEIPAMLEVKEIEREVEDLVAFEEKRKLLTSFISDIMQGAKQLSTKELIEFGRKVKANRFQELRKKGFAK